MTTPPEPIDDPVRAQADFHVAIHPGHVIIAADLGGALLAARCATCDDFNVKAEWQWKPGDNPPP